MNRIQVIFMDHHSADLSCREVFSFPERQVRELLRRLKEQSAGEWVLLSTCNRTEIYGYGELSIDPVELLCEGRSVEAASVRGLFRCCQDADAVCHLMEVACGLHSRILCEDQIITQVRRAAEVAHQEGASGAVLQTLFRLAVTAAKRAKTQVQPHAVPRSAAAQAVALLTAHFGTLAGRKALVIGNGEMGRLCAEQLRDAGCQVTVTLRTYRHGETRVPSGCRTVDYHCRVQALEQTDLVVSATQSPHFTLTEAMMREVTCPPGALVDLAVPRDLDPSIGNLPGVYYINIDDINEGTDEELQQALEEIGGVIEKYIKQFWQWMSVHEQMDELREMREVLTEKVSRTLMQQPLPEDTEELIRLAVEQTVDCLASDEDPVLRRWTEKAWHRQEENQ